MRVQDRQAVQGRNRSLPLCRTIMRASTPSDGNGGMPGADAAQPRLARGVSCMSATTTSIAPTPLIEHLAQTPEWVENNGSRIRGLYSALPPARDVNAAAWDDKLHFWQRMLLEVTKEGLLGRWLTVIRGTARVYARKDLGK